MVRAIVRVRVRVRLGDAVVRNAVGRKVGNRSLELISSFSRPGLAKFNKIFIYIEKVK